jgi:hypothetical protein
MSTGTLKLILLPMSWFQAGLKNGTNAPVLLFGILSAVLLAGALLPQYWEIYKFKEVKGMSSNAALLPSHGKLS